jgi:hypothetical protein
MECQLQVIKTIAARCKWHALLHHTVLSGSSIKSFLTLVWDAMDMTSRIGHGQKVYAFEPYVHACPYMSLPIHTLRITIRPDSFKQYTLDTASSKPH